MFVSSFLSRAISFPSEGKASKIVRALNPVNVPISRTFLIWTVVFFNSLAVGILPVTIDQMGS